MARRAVKLSANARRWFIHRVAELNDLSPSAAMKLVERFGQFRENLAEFSGMGVAGDIPGTRRVVMAPYVLTVRVRPTTIEIVAMRHGRQKDARAPDEAKS
ncbi:type II toxin-antitoxin system RelE/ParE family toxin [Rhizobium sp.]